VFIFIHTLEGEMKLLAFIPALLLLALSGCDTFSYPFTQVGSPYEMSFTPTDSGLVRIVVRDSFLDEIRVLEPGVQVPGGTPISRTWDLDDEDGAPVEDGLYFVEASLESVVFSTLLLEVSR
jgi:hypothetical protein